MGNSVVPLGGQSGYIFSGKRTIGESYNTRVALWQLPYNENYLKYDADGSKWYESINNQGDNEIEQAEHALNMNMDKYKVRTKITDYNDGTYDIESKFPNQNTMLENHGKEHVFVWIKNKFNQLVAEKIFNFSSKDGRKIVYKNIKQGEDTFTVVKVYSYDTTKNRATDVVNYAYTSLLSAFTRGGHLEKEYYMLNGKEVNAVKTDNGGYKLSKNGKALTFLVE